MSRLDSVIRRLQAQRSCIDWAAAAVAELPGPVLELGLGNGRTYDHLRDRLPGREIFAFDLSVRAHPDCVPDDAHLILGDFAETLPQAADRFAGQVSLLHADIGSGEAAITRRSAELVGRHMDTLLQPGGIGLCDQELSAQGLEVLPLPEGVAPGRYFIYRRGKAGA